PSAHAWRAAPDPDRRLRARRPACEPHARSARPRPHAQSAAGARVALGRGGDGDDALGDAAARAARRGPATAAGVDRLGGGPGARRAALRTNAAGGPWLLRVAGGGARADRTARDGAT